MIWLFIKPKTKANLQFHILKFTNFSVWIFISAKQSVPQVTIAYSYISWPQRMKLRWNCRSFKKVGNLFRREIFIFFLREREREREASIGWKIKIVRNNWRSHFATIFPLCYWRKKQSFVCFSLWVHLIKYEKNKEIIRHLRMILPNFHIVQLTVPP